MAANADDGRRPERPRRDRPAARGPGSRRPGLDGRGRDPRPRVQLRRPEQRDNFNAVGVAEPTPPDTNGDIGPNHYVQTVNLIIRDLQPRRASLLGPLPQQHPLGGLRRRPARTTTRRPHRPLRPAGRPLDDQPVRHDARAGPIASASPSRRRPIPSGAWYRYDFPVSSTEPSTTTRSSACGPTATTCRSTSSAASRGSAGTALFAFERDQDADRRRPRAW